MNGRSVRARGKTEPNRPAVINFRGGKWTGTDATIIGSQDQIVAAAEAACTCCPPAPARFPRYAVSRPPYHGAPRV